MPLVFTSGVVGENVLSSKLEHTTEIEEAAIAIAANSGFNWKPNRG